MDRPVKVLTKIWMERPRNLKTKCKVFSFVILKSPNCLPPYMDIIKFYPPKVIFGSSQNCGVARKEGVLTTQKKRYESPPSCLHKKTTKFRGVIFVFREKWKRKSGVKGYQIWPSYREKEEGVEYSKLTFGNRMTKSMLFYTFLFIPYLLFCTSKVILRVLINICIAAPPRNLKTKCKVDSLFIL